MNNHHHPRRRHNQNRSAPKHGGNGQTALQPGSVIFRLLCQVDAAGGVIGSSGTVVKQLEIQTGCKIRLEEPLPNCHERVINVIGDAVMDKKFKLKNNEALGGRPQLGADHGGECLEVEVSTAQLGLMRVFDRVLEVQRNDNGVIGCRLLAGLGQVGGVMGKGGKIVLEIQKNSGAKIRVLKKDQTPSCATPSEELIQITGDVMAVKKALVAVSHCLQVAQERKRSYLPSHPESQDTRADFLESYDPVTESVSGSHSSSVGGSLSEDVENILRLDKESARREVVFRLLCSNGSAGGVIGKGASVVKEMEKETGASIKFSSPVAGLKERVATISSLESQDSLHSFAQNATVLVFARLIEVALGKGSIADLSKGGNVNARILVTPNEINCLTDDRGNIASDIRVASLVEIQLLETNHTSNCTAGNDKVVKIVGEYEKVKSALFQVAGRLRDNLFSSSRPGEAGPRQQSYSATSTSSPYGKCTTPESDNPDFPFANQIKGRGFIREVGGSRKPRLQHEKFKDRRKTRNQEDGAQNLSEGAVGQKSVDAEAVIIRTTEVFVPGKAFGSVYGENGSNLMRIKEISGAKVMLEDPSPGRSDGKVIISGTHESILVAQSLLQAFIRP